jgi:hypothetical protein
VAVVVDHSSVWYKDTTGVNSRLLSTQAASEAKAGKFNLTISKTKTCAQRTSSVHLHIDRSTLRGSSELQHAIAIASKIAGESSM